MVFAVATLCAVRAPLPDVFVSDRGDTVAVRGASGRLSAMRTTGSDGFALREWLAADADARAPTDAGLRDGVSCDEIGCVAKLADGTIVALPFAAQAFAEDCRQATLVVSQRTAPPGCAAVAIDRTVWPKSGASVLYRKGKEWETVAAYPAGYDRPWAKAARRPRPAPSRSAFRWCWARW